MRERETVPAGRENVGEQREGGLVLRTWRQDEGIEVREGDTQVLCLFLVVIRLRVVDFVRGCARMKECKGQRSETAEIGEQTCPPA